MCPVLGAKKTVPSAFQIGDTVPGERLLASRTSLQEQPQCPQEQAGHLEKPPPKHATVKDLLEEYRQAPEAAVRGPGEDRYPKEEEEHPEEVPDTAGAREEREEPPQEEGLGCH